MNLTLLVCTHNRRRLLERLVLSLEESQRADGTRLSLLVVANACTDDTKEYLAHLAESNTRPMRIHWTEEKTPGKSHALNTGLRRLPEGWVALVDDDHRVSPDFILQIRRVIDAHPDVRVFCGVVRPDWQGHEPRWVHDRGPYRIYPLPVPHFEPFPNACVIDRHGPIPGGGNLIIHSEVFTRVGGFSTALGPVAGGLAGSEDTEWVLRALAQGFELRYEPSILQYHHVDVQRLRMSYLLRKAYHRTRTSTGIGLEGGGVPRYLWRKLGSHMLRTVLSLSAARTRFHSVRTAATLGEIRAYLEARGSSRSSLRP